MSWKLGLTAGLVLAGALTFGFAAPVSAITKPETVRLLSVTESEAEIQDGVPGFSVGDGFAFRDGLYRWAGRERGPRSGSMNVLCTVVSFDTRSNAATVHCRATARLAGGTVELAGAITFTELARQYRVAVVGGTGRFANARGELRIRDIGGEESAKSALVLELQP